MKDIDSKVKTAESENKKMFRARFDMFVLNALYEHDGASYGYDIINYIQNRTKGHYKIKTFSTIYNTLKRLEENGFVVSGEGDGKTNGATRVYYSLTEKGKEYLEENKKEYMYLRTLLDNLLTDEDFDLENDEPPLLATELKPLTKRVRLSSGENSESEVIPNEALDVSEEVAADAEPISSPVEITRNDILVSTTAKPVVNPVKPQTRRKNAETDYKAVFERLTYPILNAPKKTSSVKVSATKPQKSLEKSYSPKQTGSPIENLRPIVRTSGEYQDVQTNLETFEDNITKLKRSFKNDGYNLSVYKTNENEESEKIEYIYLNKFLRDSVVISSLFLIIVSLALYLARDFFGFSLTGLLVCCAIACVIALVAVLIWFRAPDKRRKDTINFKALNAGTVGFFTIFFMVDLIVSLLAVKGKGLNSPEIYIPVILITPIVIFGIVAVLLHKSERYFQK